jgi:molecular chaperone DnaK
MVITGGSALPKDDIDKMMREAEQYAEEDRKRREETETRNNADTLAYSTEKFLGENDEKIPAEVKAEVQTALDEVKKTLEGTDIDAIRTASEKLAQVSQKMGAAMYAQNQPGEEAPTADAAGEGATAQEDEVVDAEIVDEEKDKREGGAA